MSEIRVTTTGVETWGDGSPPVVITSAGAEAWVQSTDPQLQVNWVGTEVWYVVTETPLPPRRLVWVSS